MYKYDIFQNYVTRAYRDTYLDNLLLHALDITVSKAVDRAELEAEEAEAEAKASQWKCVIL